MKPKMINTRVKMYCHTCKKNFDTYFTVTNKIYSCPYCGANIDETIQKSITTCIHQVQGTNHDFYKYYLERKEPMFTISLDGLCTDAAEVIRGKVLIMKPKIINTRVKMYCHTCKKNFDTYFTVTDKIYFCPHCGANIDETMQKSITECIVQVQKINHLFYEYYRDHKEPMFTISLDGLCTDSVEE